MDQLEDELDAVRTKSLSNQTALSGTWLIGARLISRVLDFGTMLVLARALTPKDFGLVAIAMVIIYLVEAAMELPLSQALVRLPAITGPHYDTAFTLSVIRAALIAAFVIAVGWPFERFYADKRLLPLIIALSLAPAARGFVSPRIAFFSRNLDFSPDFKMEFFGKGVAFLIAVSTALLTHSYWAIALGTISAPVAAAAASYVIAPYRPRLSLSELSSFTGFLGWITASQVISALNWQTDKLLLGKLTSRAELGLFTTANDAANIPFLSLLSPMIRPLHSAFSLVRTDIARLRGSYQNSACAMLTLGLPILLGESLIAYPAVRLMFGEKWIAAAPLLQWLAVSLIPGMFSAPLGPLVMALGRTQVFFHRNLFEICIKLPLVVIGAIKMGFMGVIFARCVSETLTVIFSMIMVRRMIGLSLKEQILRPWRSIVAGTAMWLALKPVAAMVHLTFPPFTLALCTAGLVFAGITLYSTILWYLWNVTGRPPGLEAMLTGRITQLLKRLPGATVRTA